MSFLTVVVGIFCLFVGAWSQGYNNRNLNDVALAQYLRPVSSQQHILSNIQQHSQRQPGVLIQQAPSIELSLNPHQQKNYQNQAVRFPHQSPQQLPFSSNFVSAPNQIPLQATNRQQQHQFQRSVSDQVQAQPYPQYNPTPTAALPSLSTTTQDIHTQNSFTLRNFVPSIGPLQDLPNRSFSNKQFQPQNEYQSQQQQSAGHRFAPNPQYPSQIEQKLPRLEPTLPFISSPQQLFNKPQTTQIQAFPQRVAQQQQFQQEHQQLPQHLHQQQYHQQPYDGNIQSQNILPLPNPHAHPTPTYFSNNPPLPQAQPLIQSSDQEYKQKLIQKHEQFVQKQYEKSQNKVKQLHEDFVQKQQHIRQDAPLNVNQQQHINNAPPRSRPVLPSEYNLFDVALNQHYRENPTTTTTTTTTTTQAPTSTRPVHNSPRFESERTRPTKSKAKPARTIGRDELLKQLKTALADTPQKEVEDKPFEEMDLVLPTGERVQVIRTRDPNLIKGQRALTEDQFNELLAATKTTDKPSLANIAPDDLKDFVLANGNKVQIVRAPEGLAGIQNGQGGIDLSSLAGLYGGVGSNAGGALPDIASSAVISSDSDTPPSIEELAKRGLIPEGFEIEGISSKRSSAPAPTAPPKKKATYVYLEEQLDGSFRIQGIKANGEKESKSDGSELDSILERIQSGEVKLPPSVTKLILPNDQLVTLENGKIVHTAPAPVITTTTTTVRPTTRAPTTSTPTATTRFPRTSERPKYIHSRESNQLYTTTVPTYFQQTSEKIALHDEPTTYRNTLKPFYHTSPSPMATTPQPVYQPTTAYPTVAEQLKTTTPQEQAQQEQPELQRQQEPNEDLIQILKTNGLFAMAKYLKQSGLDTILNETGPFTIFVPTDRAFKNLLIQLGGPERAEEKFKSNPRLLSGLLLHHVIPGAFEISSLQDEMTGVSLAGTQLRVNQYTMHDHEWNDIVLTTINGAMVVNDRKDIKIPQGVAHAVDRVMFPLPVGDLLQTLQSDRDSRFSTFLKILYMSGLSEKLQGKGIKTYTVFAPTEKAFRELEPDVLEKLLTDKDAAEQFAMKHIVSGTLFSAGMRFYQVKDSLLTGKTVILQKTSAGKIKVNDTQMITSNTPATNGVIHAIDGVLS